MLNSVGSAAMGLMVPVLAAYIGEAVAKRSGLIVGMAVGMIAYNGGQGSGFLGAIVGGYMAGLVILMLQKVFAFMPDKEFRGLKSYFSISGTGCLHCRIDYVSHQYPDESLESRFNGVVKRA